MERNKDTDREDIKPKVYQELMDATLPIQQLMANYGRKKIELEKVVATQNAKIAALEKDLAKSEKRFKINDEALRNKERSYKILTEDFRKEKMYQSNYRKQLEKKIDEKDEKLCYQEYEKSRMENRIIYLESKIKEYEYNCEQLKRRIDNELINSHNTIPERHHRHTICPPNQHQESSYRKRKTLSDEDSGYDDCGNKRMKSTEKPKLRYVTYNPIRYYTAVKFHDQKEKVQMPIEIDIESLMSECKRRGYNFDQLPQIKADEKYQLESRWEYVSVYVYEGKKGPIRLFFINNWLTIGDSFLFGTVREALKGNKILQAIHGGSELTGGTISPGQIKRQINENLRYIPSKVAISFGLHDLTVEKYQNALTNVTQTIELIIEKGAKKILIFPPIEPQEDEMWMKKTRWFKDWLKEKALKCRQVEMTYVEIAAELNIKYPRATFVDSRKNVFIMPQAYFEAIQFLAPKLHE